jgi:hypothetical protein
MGSICAMERICLESQWLPVWPLREVLQGFTSTRAGEFPKKKSLGQKTR